MTYVYNATKTHPMILVSTKFRLKSAVGLRFSCFIHVSHLSGSVTGNSFSTTDGVIHIKSDNGPRVPISGRCTNCLGILGIFQLIRHEGKVNSTVLREVCFYINRFLFIDSDFVT